MKEYIIAVVCVGIVGAIVSFLAPEGEGGGVGRTVRLIVGLVTIIVCIFPVFGFLDELRALSLGDVSTDHSFEEKDYEEIFKNEYLSAETENLKYGIAALLEDKFGVGKGECSVSVRFTDTNREIERVFITLYGASVWKDTEAIEGYLEGLLNCDIITAIG